MIAKTLDAFLSERQFQVQHLRGISSTSLLDHYARDHNFIRRSDCLLIGFLPVLNLTDSRGIVEVKPQVRKDDDDDDELTLFSVLAVFL